jgi:recombination protein RecR
MADTLKNLTEYFGRFPGIGPRQAKRFVYFLLSEDKNTLKKLARHIEKLKEDISQCAECLRFFEPKEKKEKTLCVSCETAEDPTSLLLVEKDQDLETIHKSGTYKGKFFVLGGLIPILDKEPEKRIRGKELIERISKDAAIKEVIIALSANPEGDYTVEKLRLLLTPISKEKDIRISIFGRGLSTGTELEYSDPDTIKNALKNRG